MISVLHHGGRVDPMIECLNMAAQLLTARDWDAILALQPRY